MHRGSLKHVASEMSAYHPYAIDEDHSCMFRPRRQHSRVTKLNHMDIGILVPTKHQQLLPKNVVRKMRQILVCVAAHKATSEVVVVVKIIVAAVQHKQCGLLQNQKWLCS